MLLGQVLELVIVEVAAQPHCGQDEDLPVSQAGAPAVSPTRPVDVLGDGLEQVIAQLGSAVDVLKGGEQGDDLVAAGGVEPNRNWGSKATRIGQSLEDDLAQDPETGCFQGILARGSGIFEAKSGGGFKKNRAERDSRRPLAWIPTEGKPANKSA